MEEIVERIPYVHPKPTIDQEVIILYNGNLYQGKVIRMQDTMGGPWLTKGITYTFTVLIKDFDFKRTSFTVGGKSDCEVYSSSFHYEPLVNSNINWTDGRFFSGFIFASNESFEKWKLNERKMMREYHLSQAEFYK